MLIAQTWAENATYFALWAMPGDNCPQA